MASGRSVSLEACSFSATLRPVVVSSSVASMRISSPNCTSWPHKTVSALLNCARRAQGLSGQVGVLGNLQVRQNLRNAVTRHGSQRRRLSDLGSQHVGERGPEPIERRVSRGIPKRNDQQRDGRSRRQLARAIGDDRQPRRSRSRNADRADREHRGHRRRSARQSLRANRWRGHRDRSCGHRGVHRLSDRRGICSRRRAAASSAWRRRRSDACPTSRFEVCGKLLRRLIPARRIRVDAVADELDRWLRGSMDRSSAPAAAPSTCGRRAPPSRFPCARPDAGPTSMSIRIRPNA